MELRRSKKKVGAATVNRCIAHLKALFSWLVETERVAASPLRKLKMLPEFKGEEPIRIVEPARFEALVAELERFPHWANACVALQGTGMRWSSLVKLRPEHLDQARRVVRLVRPKGKVAIEIQVPHDRVWNALVWCARWGRFNADVGAFNKALRKAARAAGVAKVTAHMFRHTFAVRVLEAGLHVRDAQRLLGHAQITTTERYLRHAQPKAAPAIVAETTERSS
jgi:integrase